MGKLLKTIGASFIAIAIVVSSAGEATATLVTANFEGTVAEAPSFLNSVGVGDAIHLSFTIDTDTTDLFPSDFTNGRYLGALSGISAAAGGVSVSGTSGDAIVRKNTTNDVVAFVALSGLTEQSGLPGNLVPLNLSLTIVTPKDQSGFLNDDLNDVVNLDGFDFNIANTKSFRLTLSDGGQNYLIAGDIHTSELIATVPEASPVVLLTLLSALLLAASKRRQREPIAFAYGPPVR